MKIFMFNYWNDLALDSEETYFLEVSAHVSETSHRRCLRVLFLLNLTEKAQFFKYKNTGEGSKNCYV